MRLSAVAISFMFVVTRVIDGVTDLLVGYCIDKTNTRWGKSFPIWCSTICIICSTSI
ncbi:MFS/sugar transport family protein [Clostridioides difficile CD69]|nr:MFS/sugar transport family protein [Clostridioides difficile CD69]